MYSWQKDSVDLKTVIIFAILVVTSATEITHFTFKNYNFRDKQQSEINTVTGWTGSNDLIQTESFSQKAVWITSKHAEWSQ